MVELQVKEQSEDRDEGESTRYSSITAFVLYSDAPYYAKAVFLIIPVYLLIGVASLAGLVNPNWQLLRIPIWLLIIRVLIARARSR